MFIRRLNWLERRGNRGLECDAAIDMACIWREKDNARQCLEQIWSTFTSVIAEQVCTRPSISKRVLSLKRAEANYE